MNTNIFNNEGAPARNGDYIKATQEGFNFGNTLATYNKLLERFSTHLGKDKEEISDFKIALSFLALFVAVILGMIEGNNVKLSLMAMGCSEALSIAVGGAFCCLGLIVGEELNAGLVRDEFTGTRKPTPRFWGAVLMLVIYVGIQIFLSLSASEGGAEDLNSAVMFTVIFSILICLAEIVFGFIFFKIAATSIFRLVLKTRIRLVLKKLKKLAKKVENLWSRYLYNMQRANVQPENETQAVSAARRYYAQGGFSDTDNSFTEN